MKYVSTYLRCAGADHGADSIYEQLYAVERYCNDNGYKIVRAYIDYASSGISDDRPAFKQMIANSEKALFEAAIVYKFDRFSRDKYQSILYKQRLKENGVELLSVTENLDSSRESLLLNSMNNLSQDSLSMDTN